MWARSAGPQATAPRIVSRVWPASAKAARRVSGVSFAQAVTARPARHTRRWTGKKGRQRDDPARQPRRVRGKNRTGRWRTVRMVADGHGILVADALASPVRVGPRSAAAVL